MQKNIIVFLTFCVAAMLANESASALQCGDLRVSDSLAQSILDRGVAGQSKKLNRRKTLVLEGVDSITGTNCEIKAELDVTLKRKIRRNAKGTVVVKGTLRIEDGRICIDKARVAKVHLSNTLRIGEAAYTWVANRALPDNRCF